ncbi:hypothetical protein [Hungatella hathewayi]|nr:hypothetical protein [Hungatella hathewayi]
MLSEIYINQVSGELQKLAIARALYHYLHITPSFQLQILQADYLSGRRKS